MIVSIDKEKMNFMCNRTMNKTYIQISNSKIWTYFLDNKLKDFVIEYNFNFADIANRFQEFIAYPYKYDFTEEEIRRHWAFLHSCRYLGKEIDEDFYDTQKKNFSHLAQEEEDLIISEKIDFEKEQKEQEKIRRERDLKYASQNPNKVKSEKEKSDEDKKNQAINGIEKIKLKDIKQELEEEVNTDMKIKNDIKTITNNNKNTNTNANTNKIDFISNSEIKNIIKKEKENTQIGLEFNDDDVINALFKGANDIKLDYGDLGLTIPGKDYKLPEVDPKDWAELPSELKFLPNHELSEEEKVKKREEMLKVFNEKEKNKNNLLDIHIKNSKDKGT